MHNLIYAIVNVLTIFSILLMILWAHTKSYFQQSF